VKHRYTELSRALGRSNRTFGWPCLSTVFCLLITTLLLPLSALALSNLPFHEDFKYADGSTLDGVNGWEKFTTGPGYGLSDTWYHGWQGVPGGSVTATNSDGRVAGLSLLRNFGDYTGEPGTGWPNTSGEFDKAPLVTVRYEYEPDPNYVHDVEPTVWSKHGNMYWSTRWHYEGRGGYYKMMTVVRYFVKTNGLISAYNGHRIKHLVHTPITNRTTMTVIADYSNRVWSLWSGDEEVVSSFSLYKTDDAATMSHDGWFKDYDGLKEVGFTDASTNAATLIDSVRIFEGLPDERSLPFIETFETRTLGGTTITMSPGDLNGQNNWFATDADILNAAQSSEPYSVGSNGVAIAGGGECFQLFLDEETNVWSSLWVKPLASGSGNTTVDAGGDDAVFYIDSSGDVYAYDGASASVVTSVVATVWSQFTIHNDYGDSTWSLYEGGDLVVTGLGFKRTETDNSYEEIRISASGTVVAHLDDMSVSLSSPFNLPTVSFQSDMVAVGENVANVTVTAYLSHAHITSIGVDYVLRSGGTAALADDYNVSDGTLIFSPGETEKSFSFQIVNDAHNEEDETLFFSLTNIVNATAGSYLDVTYTIVSDPDDWGNIPFYEPYEERDIGDLHGQRGWTATYMEVQTNDTYAGSKAGQGVRIGSRHAHAFDNGIARVLAEWRAKPVFATHAPIPPDGSTYAFYVSTNGHVIAYDGATKSDMGIYTTLNEGEWAHFKVYVDHVSETWELHVNDSLLGSGLDFYSPGTGTFTEFGAVGPVVMDEVNLQFAAPVAPNGLVAVPGDSTVDLSWNTAIGGDLYRIKRGSSPGGPYSTLATLPGTNFQDVTALNDGTYYYVVSSLNEIGEGINSTETSATPRAVILGLSAVGGFNLVDITWDAYAGATNYLLLRATQFAGPYSTIASLTGTSYQDLAVVNETTYYYMLTAVTPGYLSPDSDIVVATPDLRTIFYDSFENPDISGRLEYDIQGWERQHLNGNSDTRAGLWDENTTSMITPFGEQAAYVWNERMITTTNITEALASNATYRLTFNTAAEYGLGNIEYYVELLAGTNILGVATSGWELDTLDFTYRSDRIDFTVPTNFHAIGQALGVRIKYLSGDWHYVVGYDNVRLATDDVDAVQVPNADTTPPSPDPMSFAAAPAALDDSRVRMTATTASDETGPVTYLFENTSNANVRTWSTSASWTESGLSVGQTYGYRVKARDAELNETGWSTVLTATPQNETVPPTPNPMTFAVSPTVLDQTRVMVTASIASDPSVPVQYLFENVTNGNTRAWGLSTVWTNTGLTEGEAYGYRVKARDVWSNETAWSAIATAVPTHENDPPLPNPMQFSVPPVAIDQFSIAMTAAPAIDDSGPVQYMFENTSNGNIRAWSPDRVWTNTALSLGVTYAYRVKARDVWSNETAWSSISVRRTKLEIDPPNPDPMTFAGVPAAIDETRIVMTASIATDLHGPVLYRFENMTNGNVRNWSPSAVWTNWNLFPGQTHGYRVKARDAELNETAWSTVVSATTIFDTTPPTPNPMEFIHPPAALDTTSIAMTATTATDPFYAVSYYFENLTNGNTSGWVSSPAWTNTGLIYALSYGYRVKARDAVSNETAWSAVSTALAEDVLFYDSFEDPIISGTAGIASPGWLAPNGRGYQHNRDGGKITTIYGNQVASVFLGNQTSHRLETTGIAEVLQAGTTYTLSFNAGNVNVDTGAPRTDNQYTAELLAGGTVVATATGITTQDKMLQTEALSFKPAGNDPNLGGGLQIRLMMTAGDWHAHSLFDNVRLVAARIPRLDWSALAATALTTNSASLHATLAVEFTNAHVTVHWGTTDGGGDPSSWDQSVSMGNVTNVLTTNLVFAATGLASGTQYYYSFQASNTHMNVWAPPNQDFWTSGKPGVDTAGGATGIDVGAAMLEGRVVSTGGVSLAHLRIYFGDEDGGTSTANWDTNYDIAPGSVTVGVPFATNVTGLLYGIEYDYRVYASNVFGEGWSDVATFATLPPATEPELTADGQTFTAYFDDYGGQSWLLIGRGRDGWDFDTDGQGVPGEVSLNVGTTSAFPPKAFSDAIVNDLFTQASMGLSSVTLRVSRASSTDGTGEEQELRFHTLTGFPSGNTDFTFDFDNSSYWATIQRLNAPAGLAGATIGSKNDDLRDHSDGNDARRVFTYAWSSHNNRKGFSYGSSVSGIANNDPNTFVWEYSNENHALPYTEVYIPYERPALDRIGITNTVASNIGAVVADLGGTLDADNAVFTVYAYYSTNDNADATAWLADGSAVPVLIGSYTNVSGEPVIASVASLIRGQTYYYTMIATNEATDLWATPNASFTTDGTAPDPDPMTFAGLPAAKDSSTVVMSASIASDALNNPVQYYFENTTNSNNSGWSSSTVWTNSGLATGITYGYRVKARDAVSNETAYSAIFNATPAVDVLPPNPSPLTWASVPTAVTDSEIVMTATTATDPNSPVEYYFENLTNGNNSGWITMPSWSDTGLTIGETYGYRVRAQDALGNPTTWSTTETALAQAPEVTIFFGSFEDPASVTSVTDGTDPTGWSDVSPTGNKAGLGDLSSSAYVNYDGAQAAWLNVYNANPVLQTTTSVLNTNLQALAKYVLSFKAASSTTSYTIFADLLAGTNVIGTAQRLLGNSKDFNNGITSVTLLPQTGDAGIGEAVSIRLRVTGGAWNQHCYVDELRLTVTDTSGDTVAPNPNPPTWVQAPAQSDSNSVMMVATTATDPAFVEYLFTNTVSGHSSGWQDTRMWINTALTPGVTNAFRVKTRDKSPNQNETAWSAPLDVFVDPALVFYASFEWPVVTSEATGTDPAGWSDVSPSGTGAGLGNLASSGYANFDSDQAARLNVYNAVPEMETTSAVLSAGLDAFTEYTLTFDAAAGNNGYTVYADLFAGTTLLTSASVNPSPNGTSKDFGVHSASNTWVSPGSGPLIGQTLKLKLRVTGGAWNVQSYADNLRLTRQSTAGDSTPPTPDPMGWAQLPTPALNASIFMMATNATDPNQVEYLFTNTVNGNVSGWQDELLWTDTGLTDGVSYTYRVKARDKSAGQNDTGWSSAQSATADDTIILYDSFELPVISGRTPENGTMAPGWTRSNGRVGLWNEDSGTMSTPFGYQSAWVWNARYMTTTAGLLPDTLTAGTTYTLAFNAAAENGNGAIDYDVELLAGGTVLSSVNGGPLGSSNHGIASDSLAFTAGPGHSKLGNTLAVRLRYVTGNWNYVLGYDNVTLTAVPGNYMWNRYATNITTTTASLMGMLNAPQSTFDVNVYWSTQNNANASAWLLDSSAFNTSMGSHGNVTGYSIAEPVTSLIPDTTYFYTMQATNGMTNIWADTNASFDTESSNLPPRTTVFKFR
jgi:hypothetical protein